MVVSRPLILALLAAVLCAMTFYAATGAQRTSGVSSAAAPEPSAPPAAEPARERPEPARERPEAARERERAADGERAGARGDRARREGAPDRLDRRRRTAAAPLPPELRVEGLPRPVARALAAKRTLVLFFRQRGADDSLVADAVRSVRRLRGVAVFTAPIERLARYRAVTGGLGLAQAPAIAIIDGKRRARVVEGYVDPGTLRQLVLDAR